MKVRPDENLPHELRPLLTPMHDAFTVAYLGWAGTANGHLLTKAAADGFDVLITTDCGYEQKQNLTRLRCGVVLLLCRSNKTDDVRPLLTPLLLALDRFVPFSLVKLTP